MQMKAGACGIVSAKVSEAEPFTAAGIEDICIAYPVVGEMKWRRVAALAKRVTSLTVNCDCAEAARGLSKAAAAVGATIRVQIDIDSGLHRGAHLPGKTRLRSSAWRGNTVVTGPAAGRDHDLPVERISGSAESQRCGHAEGGLLVENSRPVCAAAASRSAR